MQRFAAHGRRSATIPGRREPDDAPGGHAHDQPRAARSQRGLPLPVLETLPKTTKLTYEVCHGQSGSNSRLLSSLPLAERAALRDAHGSVQGRGVTVLRVICKQAANQS